METPYIASISFISICIIEYLKDFSDYLTIAIQITIGILTIIYLFKKIKHFKP